MPAHKIDLQKHIKALVDEVQAIEGSDADQRDKTTRFKAAAQRFKSAIYTDKRRFGGKDGEKKQIKLNTYNTYLTRARKQVEELGLRHHLLDRELGRLHKRYPSHLALIKTLEDQAPKETRLAKKTAEEQLKEAAGLRDALDDIDFSKPSAKRKIERLASQHPLYATLLNMLVGGEVAAAAYAELHRALDEVQPLLSDLMSLKVNHEVMYHLVMDKAARATHTDAKEKNLSKKKRSAIAIDYPAYIQRIYNLLTNPTVSTSDGTMYGLSPLCFAIAAATGRRPIEVLVQGDFRVIDNHRLGFAGQAKKRDGTDEQEREIYTLVDAPIVVEAIKQLRLLPNVAELAELMPADFRSQNELVSNRTAPMLNKYAKDFFADQRRMFKDVRSIYGRICYERWFHTDPRWKDADDDVFFAELLGHEDETTQMHYKQFKARGLDAKFKPVESQRESRLEKLQKLDGAMQDLANGDAAVKLHSKMKALLEQDPDVKVTQSVIIKTTGSNRDTIKRYMELCADALGIEQVQKGKQLRWQQKDEAELPVLVEVNADDQEEQLEEDAADQEAEDETEAETEKDAEPEPQPEPKKAQTRKASGKPRMDGERLENGRWRGSVTVDGTVEATATAGDKMEAMRQAWRRYQDDNAVAITTVPYKRKDQVKVEIKVFDQVVTELVEKGDGDAVEAAAWEAFRNRS